MAWYTLQTNPNYEAKVIAGIQEKQQQGLVNQIREIFAPEEVIVEFKEGKKKERKKRLYSNYLFIEMDMDDDVWHHLRGIRGIVGFVGNRAKPTQVSLKEIEFMKAQVSEDAPKPKIIYAIDSEVRIKSGSFADFVGIVKNVDYDKNKAKIAVQIFGRETIMDIELSGIEIIK